MADGGQEHWWEPYSAEMLATILKTITLKAEADQDDIEARLQSAAIFFKRGRNRSVQAPSEQIREWERLALRLQGVEQDFASMPIIPEKGDLIYSVPIRLSPIPTTSRVLPIPRVKLGLGRAAISPAMSSAS